MTTSSIKLIECPRDAMQGWKIKIPTQTKIDYINSLLQVGFDTIDFGSFVSPKAIPQMADTKDVLKGLILNSTRSKLLAIVANTRGAEEASIHPEIQYLGFPFSVSETFQQRNTNSSIPESLKRVEEIQLICQQSHKQLVIYISMAFGNPYGDAYSAEIIFGWIKRIAALGVKIISLADTVGLATAEQVYAMTSYAIKQLPDHEIGVHLHSTPDNRIEKIDAAINAGCRRIDGALMGIGGCPMANDDLIGNINTEWLVGFLEQRKLLPAVNMEALQQSLTMARTIFR